jgi:ADP-ribose pyrophosphatase YjhB (NUDIX family)
VVYLQLKVGAGVLVEREGSLLLVQRGAKSDAFPGAWNLPAGYCEVDESPSAAATREATEETGLQVQVGQLVDAYFFDDDPRGNGLLLVYEAEIVSGDLDADGWNSERSDEVAAACFFGPDRLPALLSGGGHDQAIEAWQRRALESKSVDSAQDWPFGRAQDWQPGMPLRYCPHCTHPLEERLSFGRLRPGCPACGYTHFQAPKVGVSVLAERDGKVLLVQRGIDPGRGKWCLPSGFIEWDEAPEDAAIRECAEETGLAVAHVELLEVTHYTQDFRGPGINLAYRARAKSGTLQPGDDAVVARWFAATELPPEEMIAFSGHYDLLKRWRNL